MTSEGPEMIGREILRLEAETEREGDRWGKERRKETAARLRALRWSLHAVLTGDRSRSPGAEVEAFLGALKGRDGGTQ